MRRFFAALACSLLLLSCAKHPAANTVVMIIESSPTNLDPRIGTDSQSERIDILLFDSLVKRDDHFDLRPSLADRWNISSEGLTYDFHLRSGVRFSNGASLTSRDVKWTFESVMNGTITTAKTSTYKAVSSIDAPAPDEVIFHLKEPDSGLLWNMSDGAMGIVPYGAGKDFAQHLVGSGAFKFVSASQDDYVLVEANKNYWAGAPHVDRVRFAVIPDTTTRVLELRKGSADIEINAITPDMVETVRNNEARSLVVQQEPGTTYQYLALNLRDPILKDVRVRDALAYAVDRQAIIHYLLRETARPAQSILPPQSWAYTDDVAKYPYDPQKAIALLEAAGYRADAKTGVRLELMMKTSTDETTRLFAAVLQEQLSKIGVRLDIRSYEFATFYSDVVKGSYQLYSLRWIGGNQDPDIFRDVFDSASFPPKRFNRSYFSNPEVDSLIDDAGKIEDRERRRMDYVRIQRIVAQQLPYINLWYLDNVVVHTRRVTNLHIPVSGNYDFLRDIELER